MQLPLILISSDEGLRQDKVGHILSELSMTEENPNVLRLTEKLGIESIKQIKNHLFLKSGQNKSKVIIIDPADTLTHDAQNALLKLLEEPQENVLFILGVLKEESLLNTVRSRCRMLYLATKLPELSIDEENFIHNLLSENSEKRFELVEKIENKKEWLNQLAAFYHQKMRQDLSLSSEVKKVLTAQKWMRQNVMPKAVIDYLMLVLKKP